MFQIQVNQKIVATSKLEYKEKARKYNQEQNWTTVSCDVLELYNIIAQGNTVRGAIKVGGNTKSSIKSIQWLLLDLDKSSFKSTLDTPYTEMYGCLWYKTPSYVEGKNEKHRLVFRLSRDVNVKEYEILYKKLLTFYPKADKCYDAGRIFFGAVSKENVHLISETNVLPVDDILVADIPIDEDDESENLVKEPLTKNTDEESGSVTAKVLRHIAQHAWLGACGADPNKLFCLWEHNLEELETETDKQLYRYEGRLYGSNNPNGSALLVTSEDASLPPLYYNREDEETLTIIDYWWRFQKDAKKWGKIEQKGVFKAVVNDLCQHFKIEKFEFKTSKVDDDDILKIVKDVKSKFKILYLGKQTYFGYKQSIHTWVTSTSTDHAFALFLYDYIAKTYGEDVTFNPKLQEACMRSFRNGCAITAEQMPDEMTHNLALADGNVYDTSTATVSKNVGQAHNRRVFPWSYNQEFDSVDSNGVPNSAYRVLSHLKTFTGSEITGRILYTWLALNAVGSAKQTASIVGVIGKSGSGKTSYLSMIKSLVNGISFDGTMMIPNHDGYARSVSGDALTSGYAHAMSVLEGKRSILIQELEGQVSGKKLTILKELSGNQNDNSIEINRKGVEQYTSKFLGAITFDSEGMPRIPDTNGDGYYRRIVAVQIDNTWSLDNCGKFWGDFFKWYNTEEVLSELFNYFLSLDVNALVEEFLELKRSTEVKNTMLDIRRQNSDLATFITDRLVVSNAPEDCISSALLYELHTNLCEGSKGYGRVFTSKLKFVQSIKDKLEKLFEWTGDSGAQRKVGGKNQRVFTGIRLKTEEEMDV